MQWVFLLAIAGAMALLHLLTNGRYGFHRDELQFLSDARHLDWGFVSYPPFTPFVERVSLGLFGLSMVGLRLFSVLAQATAIIVTGLMARELGGGRLAQVTAALAVALSPLPIFEGTEFQYTTFDYLWWVLIAYFTILLLKTENPRWWLAIGAAIGLGLETKYAIVFYIAGLLAVSCCRVPADSSDRLVLGRRRPRAPYLSAQLHLAYPPRFHLLHFPSFTFMCATWAKAAPRAFCSVSF